MPSDKVLGHPLDIPTHRRLDRSTMPMTKTICTVGSLPDLIDFWDNLGPDDDLPLLLDPTASNFESINYWRKEIGITEIAGWPAGVVYALGERSRPFANGFAACTGRTMQSHDGWDSLTRALSLHDPLLEATVIAVGDEAEIPAGSDLGALLRISILDIGLIAGRNEPAVAWTLVKSLAKGEWVESVASRLYAAPFFFGKSAQASHMPHIENPLDLMTDKELGSHGTPQLAFPGTVIMAAHGRSDHLGFGDVPVCGDVAAWSGKSSVAREGDRAPQCASGLGCFLPGKRIPVATVGTDILVLYSCTSGHVGSDVYEQSFNLALSALEGPARAVIATTRPMTDNGWEVPFLAGMISAGYSVGRVVRLLNSVYEEILGVPPAYIVLGNPHLRVRSQPMVLEAQSDSLEVIRPGLAIAQPINSDASEVTYQLNSTEHGSVIVNGDTLLLWGTSPFKVGEVFSPKRRDDPQASIEATAHAAVSLTTAFGTEMPLEVVTRLEKVSRIRRSLTEAYRLAPVFPHRAKEASSLLTRLENEYVKIDRVIAAQAIGRGSSGKVFDIEEYWEERFIPNGGDLRPGSRCTCGRVLAEFEVLGLETHALGLQASCMQCGDTQYRLSDAPPLEWRGLEFVDREGELTYQFTVANDKPFPVSFAISMWMSKRYGGRPHADVPVLSGINSANSSSTVQGSWSVEGLVPHRYLLNAVVVRHGSPDLYRRFVQVRP